MEWIDINEEGIPYDVPCEVKHIQGNITFGCRHKSQGANGIIKLTEDAEGGKFNWDGKTYLIKITHWRSL